MVGAQYFGDNEPNQPSLLPGLEQPALKITLKFKDSSLHACTCLKIVVQLLLDSANSVSALHSKVAKERTVFSQLHFNNAVKKRGSKINYRSPLSSFSNPYSRHTNASRVNNLEVAV